MKIQILKTGRFAHPNPSEPQVDLTAGMITIVDEAMAAELIKTGWAEEVKPAVEQEPLVEMPVKATFAGKLKKKNKKGSK